MKKLLRALSSKSTTSSSPTNDNNHTSGDEKSNDTDKMDTIEEIKDPIREKEEKLANGMAWPLGRAGHCVTSDNGQTLAFMFGGYSASTLPFIFVVNYYFFLFLLFLFISLFLFILFVILLPFVLLFLFFPHTYLLVLQVLYYFLKYDILPIFVFPLIITIITVITFIFSGYFLLYLYFYVLYTYFYLSSLFRSYTGRLFRRFMVLPTIAAFFSFPPSYLRCSSTKTL